MCSLTTFQHSHIEYHLPELSVSIIEQKSK